MEADSDTILSVNGLWKKFLVNEGKPDSFKEMVTHTVLQLLRGKQPANRASEFWALKDVSFSLRKGQSLGVIGSNGAGKSTLLKILSNITEPTSGDLIINGKSVAILEIGTGFHPDLTGAENIYLNGTLLGMNQKDIREKYFDRIVAFSGVGDFIHTPVKHYSSGMYVRLAFSVAAHIDADLLILDEVLSVGDAEFRLKAANKIKSLIRGGTSILLVTHNLAEVVDLCSHCIWLEDGKIKQEGPSAEVVKTYTEHALLQNFASDAETLSNEQPSVATDDSFSGKVNEQILQSQVVFDNDSQAPGDDCIRIHQMAVYPLQGAPGDVLYMKDALLLDLQFSVLKAQEQPVFMGFRINDINGSCAFGSSTMVNESLTGTIQQAGRYRLQAQLPAHFFNAGIFSISLAYNVGFNPLTLIPEEILYFKIHFNEEERHKPWFEKFPGVARPEVKWQHITI